MRCVWVEMAMKLYRHQYLSTKSHAGNIQEWRWDETLSGNKTLKGSPLFSGKHYAYALYTVCGMAVYLAYKFKLYIKNQDNSKIVIIEINTVGVRLLIAINNNHSWDLTYLTRITISTNQKNNNNNFALVGAELRKILTFRIFSFWFSVPNCSFLMLIF